MRRALGRILALAAGLLCSASVVLWLHSYRASSAVIWRNVHYDGKLTRWTFVMAQSGDGKLAVSPWRYRVEPVDWFALGSPTADRKMFEYAWNNGPPRWPGLSGPDYWGIQFKHLTAPYPPPQVYAGVIVTLPYWLITPLLAVVPTVYGVAWWTRRGRARDGKCVACGYDLRASRERCPECGRPIKASADLSEVEAKS